MEEPGLGTAAVCATHEGAHSTGTCARCGNFVCPLCLDEFSGLPDHCEACREREGGGLVPFEKEGDGFLKRWWAMTRAILLSPTRTIETTAPGPSIAASVVYNAFTGLIIGSCLSACGLCGVGLLFGLGGMGEVLSQPGSELSEGAFLALMVVLLVLYVVLMPIGLLLSSLLRTSAFHVTAILLGGDGAFGTSFWAMNYLHAISLSTLPLLVINQIPVLGPFLGLFASLAIEVFYAVHLTTVARRHHGLQEGRAAMAGWSFFLLIAVLGTLCCVSFVFLAIAGAPR